MCKHVAAVLYGIGARFDHQPELLFRLRAVDELELIANAGKAAPLTQHGPAAGKMLESDDLSAMFGLDMAQTTTPAPAKPKPTKKASAPPRKKAKPRKKAAAKKPKVTSKGTPKVKPKVNSAGQ